MSQRAATPLALNQRSPLSRAGLGSSERCGIFQGSSQGTAGPLPAVAMRKRAGEQRQLGDRSCSDRATPGSANGSSGPPQRAAGSGGTCEKFSPQQCISQSLLQQEMTSWCLFVLSGRTWQFSCRSCCCCIKHQYLVQGSRFEGLWLSSEKLLGFFHPLMGKYKFLCSAFLCLRKHIQIYNLMQIPPWSQNLSGLVGNLTAPRAWFAAAAFWRALNI